MSKLELKPCPFCGGEAAVEEHHSFAFNVECTRCCAEGPLDDLGNYWTNIGDAVRAWNARNRKMMGDLIRRADAIEALKDALSDLTLSHREHKMTMQCLDDLPAINPRAKGHWIVDGHHVQCGSCGMYMCNTDREGDRIPLNFCPNCGADMREDDNG